MTTAKAGKGRINPEGIEWVVSAMETPRSPSPTGPAAKEQSHRTTNPKTKLTTKK
jgi:hypothetical protein